VIEGEYVRILGDVERGEHTLLGELDYEQLVVAFTGNEAQTRAGIDV
jgi:hypothetical protein